MVQWVQLTSTNLQNFVMKAFLWTFVSQLRNTLLLNVVRCFFYAFYIKSQLVVGCYIVCKSYFFCAFYIKSQLMLDEFLLFFSYFFCAFYIKSQRSYLLQNLKQVISFAHSTSNHNLEVLRLINFELFLLRILHQITTLLQPL